MAKDIIDAIEIRGDPSFGRIRCQSGPDLIAYRPDPDRFERMRLVLGAAREMAEKELGPGSGRDLYESINAFEDAKGDFAVYWKDKVRLERYEKLVNAALLLWGEDEILHLVGESSFDDE